MDPQQSNVFEQLRRIEGLIDRAADVCDADPSVPPELKACVRQLDEETDAAKYEYLLENDRYAIGDHVSQLEELLGGVEGWMPLPEAQFLSDLAATSAHDVVEIGCYRGRSTIALCHGAARAEPRVPMVYSIDPHCNATGVFGGRFGPADREAYYRNMLSAGMARRAALINLPSSAAARAWQSRIGLLFIDMDVEEEAATGVVFQGPGGRAIT